MAPIIPAGGKKMDWVRDPEQLVEKKAQMGMFDDDPQLSAIKDLPGMQDGIAELEGMNSEIASPTDGMPADGAPAVIDAPVATGGAVEQAIEKVKDAAQGVADAAVKDVEKAVTEAVKNVGAPAPAPVSDKIDEIKPEGDDHEKSETPAEEKKEEECKDIPGVEGEKDGKVEKEGDKDEKKGDKKDKDDKDDKKPEAFASIKGMRRLAEMTSEEIAVLRHYWKDGLGYLPEYVDAMLKRYRA